jgi:hypothetical protein
MDSRLNYEFARMRMAELQGQLPINRLAREARATGKRERPSLLGRLRRTRTEPAPADGAVAPPPVAAPVGTGATTLGH